MNKKNLVIILICFLIIGGLSAYFVLNNNISKEYSEIKNNTTIKSTNNTTISNTNNEVNTNVNHENENVQEVETQNSVPNQENSNYNPDDYLSCEELKEKYPHMSDGELQERFGERGEGGVSYDGLRADERREQIRQGVYNYPSYEES
jgi:predicted nuclease with TOPRIM domain